MAIQVNGTTVIDNSRNLTNIGTVAATSYTGDGSSLTGITSGANDDLFWENGQTVTSNYTVSSTRNAMTTGPVQVNSGVTVTIEDGASWIVVV